jgi:hypothetical protein
MKHSIINLTMWFVHVFELSCTTVPPISRSNSKMAQTSSNLQIEPVSQVRHIKSFKHTYIQHQHHCMQCSENINRTDNFCRHCGVVNQSNQSNAKVATTVCGRGSIVWWTLFTLLLCTTIVSGGASDYGKNGGLWHRVGELFTREQQRQRKIKHSTADAAENGPKEISIFCPQDPQIRIVDLSEDDRDRDECLVLNIAAPDVSSRLVLFCNAHQMTDKNEGEGAENEGEKREEENEMPPEEL